MRDTRSGGGKKKDQKPKSLPPLRGPIDPPGFAVDLTPRTKKVSKEARGAAMISRGTFENYLAKHDPHKDLGAGQKKAIQILRTNRNALLKPENRQYLAAIQRTQPGDKLHTAIHADPHTADQYRLTRAGVSLSPGSRLKLQQQGLSNETIDRFAAGDITADRALALGHAGRAKQGAAMARAAEKKAGLPVGTMGFNPSTSELFQRKTAGDWFGRLAAGEMEGILGTPAFFYQTIAHPKTIPGSAKAIGQSFYETGRHPVRQLTQDPASFFNNLAAVGSAGIGATGRIASLGRAVATRAPEEGALTAAARGFKTPEYRSPWDLYTQKTARGRAKTAEAEARIREHFDDLRNLTNPDDAGQLSLLDHHEQQLLPSGRPDLPLRGLPGRVVQRTKASVKQSRAEMRMTMDEFKGASVGKSAALAYRELEDGVRAATIYLRPAYIPNNWAGNTFMNMVHQGFMAPWNLAKSAVIHKHIPEQNLRYLRTATGQTSLQGITEFKGRGFVRAATDPIARVMGKAADQPFRDSALLHELRKMGYKRLDQVNKLAEDVHKGDPEAARVLSKAGNKAAEETVRFDKLNGTEQSFMRHVFFVYNWTKGATRYGLRFPAAHPIQTAVYSTGGRTTGQQYVNQRMGGLPPYLRGVLPVGQGKAVNPFGVNPLGTTVQTGQAVAGALKMVAPGTFGQFDPRGGQDPFEMLAPIPAAAWQAHQGVGGRTMFENIFRNTGVAQLYRGLRHPGSGVTYPGTKAEAIGHFVLGSLYPRKYDPKAIQSALERMNVDHPEALIDGMKKRYQQKMGQSVPKEIENMYRKDLKELKAQKDFKTDYAHSHNSSSYRRMPASNRAEAALKYISDHKVLPPDQIGQFRSAIDSAPDDTVLGELERGMWATTSVGAGKTAWNNLMSVLKVGEKTRSRK